MTIAPEIGGTYRTRGGQIVTIKERVRHNGSDAIAFYVGDYVPPAQVRYTCQITGDYAPECGVRPHDLDLIELVHNTGETP